MRISQMLMSIAGTSSQSGKSESLIKQNNEVGETLFNKSEKLSSLIIKYSNELDENEKMEIVNFFNESSGTDKEKSAVVDIAISKGITLTQSNLEDIQTALNEAQYTSEQIDTLTVDVRTEEIGDTGKSAETVIASLKLPDAIKEALISLVDRGYTLKEALSFLTGSNGTVSDMITEISSADQTELMKVIEVAMNLSQKIDLGNFSTECFAAPAEADITEMFIGDLKTQYKGDVSVFSEIEDVHFTDSILGTIEDETAIYYTVNENSETKQIALSADFYDDIDNASDDALHASEEEVLSEDLQKLIDDSVQEVLVKLENQIAAIAEQFEIKTYLVTETTAKTIEMKNNFNDFQINVTELLSNPEMKDTASLSETVSKAIEEIDRMITKQEVTLYSSMQTERDLLVLSGELREAQNFLENGKTAEAIAIVKTGYDMMNALSYHPDKIKVMAFVTQKTGAVDALFNDVRDTKQQRILDMMTSLKNQEGSYSARDVVDTLRYLGNNHEVEVANYLESKDKTASNQVIQANVKEILLKMMKDETDQRTVETSEKSLMNLSGQQMMNDGQKQGQRHLYFFNYPLNDAGELNEMKIYLTGNERNKQLDWQNTELYFGMDLKTEGKTGIKIKVTDGDMTIKIMNDVSLEIADKVASFKATFETIGFTNVKVISEAYEETVDVAYIDYTSVNVQKENQAIKEGGVDFKV